MNQSERRQFLIRELMKENPEYEHMQIPAQTDEQRQLLRGMMNIRRPRMIAPDFLAVQDEYLQEENNREVITDITMLQPCACDSRLYLWQGDMTTLRVSGVVNPANSALRGCFIPLHNAHVR